MHMHASSCIRILEVCIHIQLSCIRRPYVCIHVLKPKNPNSTFSAFVSYFICLIFLYSSLFSHVYVFVSLFVCLFAFNRLD